MQFQDGALFSSRSVTENIIVPIREHVGLDEELMRDIAALKVATGFAALHVDKKAVHLWAEPLDAELRDAAGVDRYLAALKPPAGKPLIARYDHAGQRAKGVAFLVKEPPNPDAPDAPAYTLLGFTAAAQGQGQVAVCTIAYADDEDQDVAERIWRSIDWYGQPAI